MYLISGISWQGRGREGDGLFCNLGTKMVPRTRWSKPKADVDGVRIKADHTGRIQLDLAESRHAVKRVLRAVTVHSSRRAPASLPPRK